MIRDWLVCGENNCRIQRQLLTEPNLTLKEAVDIALAIESSPKHVEDLGAKATFEYQSPSPINQVREHQQSDDPETKERRYDCHRCGGKHVVFVRSSVSIVKKLDI